MTKIAIVGPIHDDGLSVLKKQNLEILEIDDFSSKNLIEKLKDVDGIAIRTANLSEEILENCKNLKIVSRHGVGYDNVDLNYLNQNKIALAITGTANSISVAEHVMAMFLNICRICKLSDKIVRDGKFTDRKFLPDFFELYDKNILILGFGRIGKALAKRCIGFDSKVYVYDPFVNSKIVEEHNCVPISIDEGIKLADFISIHMPINDKTKNFISKKEFLIMKKNCVLVNTSRGGIVNEKDLFWALSNNEIFGAGIDVYEKEPPEKDNPLFGLENIILSPHNAALTIECRKRMAVESCENILYYLQNQNKLNKNNIVNIKNIDL